MAIAINGSAGTITGVSTGGLPDGSVDADTLASGAVTATKMASGVGGKILTNGAGASFSGSTASTSYVDLTSFNVTPSASNSKILILATLNHVQDSTTNWATQVLRDSTEIFQRGQWKFSSTNRNFGIMTYMVLDSPSTTSQITYKITGKRTTSGGASTDGFNYGGNYLWFEVAG
tara:strand:+ start:48 stop:572 length:525 start_codon:yes stop_codon:yes gene_type:complete